MPLRGVPGVRGLVLGSVGFLVGVPGTEGRAGVGFGLPKCLERDSEERAALNFLWVDARRLGVVARGRRSVEELEEAEERGRFGVKGAGLVGFEAGVLKTMAMKMWL